VLEEQERAIVDARQSGPEAAGKALLLVLLPDHLLHLLPLHPEGRVGDQVLGLLVVPPEQVSDRPDEGRVGTDDRIAHSHEA
jgi:hypothetical protein